MNFPKAETVTEITSLAEQFRAALAELVSLEAYRVARAVSR